MNSPNTQKSDHMRIISGAMRVAFFLIIGKLAGAFKEMAIANRYGVSDVVDAYQFTQSMANWLPTTMVGAFSVVLIPIFVKLRYVENKERDRFLSELLAWLLTTGVIVAIGLYLVWPSFLSVAAGQLSEEAKFYSQATILPFAISGVMILVIGLHMARLRARERHINNLLDSLPALGILIAIFLMPEDTTIIPIIVGLMVGYVIQSIWIWYLADKADSTILSIPRWQWHSPQWRLVIQAMSFMLLGQLALSFVAPMDQMFAAKLGDNANATMGYANRLIAVVIGVGAASVGRAALPVLADIQQRGDVHQAKNMALKWAFTMVILGFILLGLVWYFVPLGVSIVFEHGAFTVQDTEVVAHILRFGLLQVPFYFGVLMLVQLLASQHRYKLMTGIALSNFAVKFLLNALLVPHYGMVGIMLATAGMYAFSFIAYWISVWYLPVKKPHE